MMKMIMQSLLWLLAILCSLILWNTSGTLAWPVRSKLKDPAKLSHDNVHNYLMEFGYLPKSDIETGNLRTEAQLKDAIRNLQRFGNIPETGEIDNRTRKLILKARCGVPDKMDAPDFSPDNLGGSRWYRDRGGGGGHRRRAKRFVIQGAKWDHTDLTWSLVNQTMSTLNAGEVRRVLTNALAVWERSSKLTFREVYSKQADIQVLFARQNHGDGYDFDGPGMVLAHAFYPGEGRGGDAHFDEEENWLLNGTHTDEGTNLMGVAVHEFGHSLGLGHSSAADAIMYPWYQGYQINGELPDDDKTAIQQLYGTKQKQWGPYNPGVRPTRPTTTTTTTTTTQRPLRYYPDRREPTYPQEPRREPVYPQEPRREPTYPQPPRREPTYPQTPRRQPVYPEDPRREPSYPDEPRRRPSWERERPDSRPSNPRYPQNDPRYPQYPKETPRHHHHNHHPHHNPRTNGNENPERNPMPRTEPPPTRYPTQRQHHHRPTYPPTTTRPRKEKPDGCKIHYDAIFMLRRELFIFSGQYMWRIGERGLYDGYPFETRRLWYKLPENLTRIDAVYENHKGKIVFFIGQQFFVFNSAQLEPGYPRPLTDLGLPAYVKKIDAALIWGHNNRTYLYSDTLYWRLDEDTGRVELDYPRDMSIWDGIGYYIDSAFQYSNGKTYFFKGQAYWEFDDSRMRVANYKPKPSAHRWMRCPRVETNEIDDPSLNAPLVSERNYAIPESGASSLRRRSWSRDILLIIVPLFMYISLVSN